MFLRKLLMKQDCPHCGKKATYLGEDRNYIKLSYYYCKNESCMHKKEVLQYRNGKYDQTLPLRVLSHEGNDAYLFHKDKQIQYWESYY